MPVAKVNDDAVKKFTILNEHVCGKNSREKIHRDKSHKYSKGTSPQYNCGSFTNSHRLKLKIFLKR